LADEIERTEPEQIAVWALSTFDISLDTERCLRALSASAPRTEVKFLMFVVGIARLAGALQDELPALAADLGMTAYDARMLLAPGIPALVLVTPEKSKALGLLGSLRARGHESLAFDTQS
jgi:hypothetical protein